MAPVSGDAGASSSAASLPSTSATSATSSSQTTELERLVEQARTSQRSKEPYSRLLLIVPDLVKRRGSRSAGGSSHAHDVGDELTHVYCDKANAWLPAPFQGTLMLQAAMIRCFAFTESAQLDAWLATQARAYFGCADCMDAFLKARIVAAERFLNGLSPSRVRQFQDHIDRWNHTWAQKLLDSRGVQTGEDLDRLAPEEMYAFLHVAVVRFLEHLPSSKDSDKEPRPPTQADLFDCLQGVSPTRILHNVQRLHPALLLLLAGRNIKLQEWAALHMQEKGTPAIGASTFSNPFFHSAVQHIQVTLASERLSYVERVRVWSSLTSALRSDEAAPLADLLSSVVLEHLQDDGSHVSYVLASFARVLYLNGSKIFSAQTNLVDFATTMLGRITDSQALFRLLADERVSEEMKRSELLGWIGPFFGVFLDRWEEEQSEVALGDCLKNVAHWCFERCQSADVPAHAAAIVLDEGLRCLLDIVKKVYGHRPRKLTVSVRRLDAETKEGAKESNDASKKIDALKDSQKTHCANVVRNILSFHAKSIVAAAAGPLTTTIGNGKARAGLTDEAAAQASRHARELLTIVFDFDAAVVADTIHRLSEHVTFFRNELARGKRGDEESLYKRAERSLIELPGICSGLWRAGYDAMETSEELTLLMMRANVPLAVFAPVVLADLLKTHMLPPPTADKESKSDQPPASTAAAYKRYLHRLESVIAAFDSRLNGTRGPLKDVMARIGFSSDGLGSEESLRQFCTEHADVVIALALSALPALRNAALSFARQAFDDTNARDECLRALLCANPVGAVEGLNRFLTTFERAAAKLVEASQAAAWMVRSFADIVNILCGTDGLLRLGSSFSIRAQPKLAARLQGPLAQLWKLMCRSVEAIYDRTPQWSKVLERTELLAWFRDVNIFASDMLDNVDLVQDAVTNGEVKDGADPQYDLDAEFAGPVVAAFQWLRLNDQETLLSSFAFVQRAVERVMNSVAVRSGRNDAPKRFLAKLETLYGKAKDGRPKCLLSKDQLSFLRILISGEEDEEDADDDLAHDADDDDVQLVDAKDKEGAALLVPRQRQPYVSSSSHSSEPERAEARQRRPYSYTPTGKSAKTSMRQPSIVASMARASEMQSNAPHRPKAGVPPSTSTSRNAYQSAGASATKTTDRTATSKQGSAFSKLKAAHKTSTVKLARRPGAAPVAPAARSSVTGTLNRAELYRKPAEPSYAVAAKKPAVVEKPAATEKPAVAEDDSSPEKPAKHGLYALHETAEEVKARQQAAIENMRRRRAQQQAARERIDGELLVQRLKREEETRKLRLQAEPDFNQLHEVILGWSTARLGDLPPNFDAQSLRQVPHVFQTADDYVAYFEPFFILNVWADFCRAREELQIMGVPRLAIYISQRSSINHFIEIVANMHVEDPKVARLADTDVVFLHNEQGPWTALAKVQDYRRNGVNHSVTLRLNARQLSPDVKVAMCGGSKWQLQRVFSLSTTHRAYEALLKLRYFKLRDAVLKAQPYQGPRVPRWDVEKILKKTDLNEPQAQAVAHALQANGFFLIQGPPGTGKTKTICGLIQQTFTGGLTKTARPKVFICAPSNAAIDEVARRVKMIELANGNKLSVVRVGRSDKINSAAADITLDVMVDARMSASDERVAQKDATQLHALNQDLRNEIADIRAKIKALEGKGGEAKNELAELLAKKREKENKRQATLTQLDEVKDKQRDTKRQQDADRIKIRRQILEGADVICSTLSGAGQDSFGNMEFETVIIDEAAQAVELEALIPLRFDCNRCILVGDQNQLPPTVLSGMAQKYGYAKSLFVRMFENAPERVHLLSIQYRMHPEISRLPSDTFYQSRLKDGPEMAQKTVQRWHEDPLLAPFKFFSCVGREVKGRTNSIKNNDEVDIALAIYGRLRRQWNADLDYRVGIISPYKDQVSLLKFAFEARYDKDISNRIDFNTVDGFQGQEKDIIIFSCVRSGETGKGGQVGFIRDPRRANVALTRAKSNLFIIGNAPFLRNDPVWGFIVSHAEMREALHAVNARTFEAPIARTVLPRAPAEGRGQAPKLALLQDALRSAGMLARVRHSASQGSRPQPQPAPSATAAEPDTYWAAEDASAAAALKEQLAEQGGLSDGDSLWGDGSDKDEDMDDGGRVADIKAAVSIASSAPVMNGLQGEAGKPSGQAQPALGPGLNHSPTAGVKRAASASTAPAADAVRPHKMARPTSGSALGTMSNGKHPRQPVVTTIKRAPGPDASPAIAVARPKTAAVSSSNGGPVRPAGSVAPAVVPAGPKVNGPASADANHAVGASAPPKGDPTTAVQDGPSASALAALFVKKRS